MRAKLYWGQRKRYICGEKLLWSGFDQLRCDVLMEAQPEENRYKTGSGSSSKMPGILQVGYFWFLGFFPYLSNLWALCWFCFKTGSHPNSMMAVVVGRGIGVLQPPGTNNLE